MTHMKYPWHFVKFLQVSLNLYKDGIVLKKKLKLKYIVGDRATRRYLV
jgi:hypothetical protein